MDEYKRSVLEKRVERTLDALNRNNMPACYVATKEEAAEKVKSMLQKGDVISCGGSVTLDEAGIKELMKSGDYRFLDREKMSAEEVYTGAFSADVFLTSSNAVTEDGLLYNVDGNGNRVAALIYGPKKVIVVAGVNKIVRDLSEAVLRVKEEAAPCNACRLHTDTPCEKLGKCVSDELGKGCSSPRRMCIHHVVTSMQRKERIFVILVGEELGY